MTRSLTLNELRQEYIVTARIKGVPERRVVWHSTAPWNSRVEYVCAADGPGMLCCACEVKSIVSQVRISSAYAAESAAV